MIDNVFNMVVKLINFILILYIVLLFCIVICNIIGFLIINNGVKIKFSKVVSNIVFKIKGCFKI